MPLLHCTACVSVIFWLDPNGPTPLELLWDEAEDHSVANIGFGVWTGSIQPTSIALKSRVMATVTHSERRVNDEPFQSLYTRFRSLETELNIMQKDYQIVFTYHGQQCIQSLRVSMTSLFEIISCVNKADKALVDWHYRSKHLKRALRLVGVDRRIHVLVEKKNQKLKTKVSVVEHQCNEASGIFADGVEATTRLGQEFVTFSMNSVGEVSKEVIQTRDVYDEDRKQVQSKIVVHEIVHQDVSAEVTSTQESLTQLRERSDQAETIRDAYTAVSGGFFFDE